MSLINDALKRARQSQRNDPLPGAPPLPPVEPPAHGGTGWILAMAVVLFLAAACLFISSNVFRHKAPPVAAAPAPAVTTPVTAPPLANPMPAPPAMTSALPPPVVNTNPPAALMEPLPKLQGIIFSAAHPLAIVNGKTVSAGDQAGDFLVKQILKTGVVLQCRDGSLKTLDIGG